MGVKVECGHFSIRDPQPGGWNLQGEVARSIRLLASLKVVMDWSTKFLSSWAISPREVTRER